ncbi:MAG: hypothetical protein IJJ78_08340 [Paludibacteraceae bacterium]|nr:hypothetical protein [Paludibacteraceae bacterium]MBR0499073.1 hypothetical protein [Paludibacteraceae bacterium]
MALGLAACSNEEAGTENGHEWVDLGLPSGTKWATCNIGADDPQDHGNYYSWGEVTTKDSYSWSFYFNSDKAYSYDAGFRCYGQSVRPVVAPK